MIAYGVLAGGFLTDAWLGADVLPVEVYYPFFIHVHSSSFAKRIAAKK